MGRIWLPPESDQALALREPALLVPGRQPVGAVVPDPSLRCIGGFVGQDVPLTNGGSLVSTQYGRGISMNGVTASSLIAKIPLTKIPHNGPMTIIVDGLWAWNSQVTAFVGGASGAAKGFFWFKGRVNGTVNFRAYGFSFYYSTVTAFTFSSSLTRVRFIGSWNGGTISRCVIPDGTADQDTLSGTFSAANAPYLEIWSTAYNADDVVLECSVFEGLPPENELFLDQYQGWIPAANEPIFIGTAGGATGTTVTLNSDSLVITDGTLTVTAQENTVVSLTADTLAIANGSLSVQADVDTNVTLAGDTLTITDGSLGVAVGNDVAVSLTPDTITITDGTLAISAAVDTVVTMVGDTLAISEGTLSVQADVDTTVTLNSGAITITDASLGVNVVRTVNLVPDSITITDGTLGVTAVQNTVVDLAAAALTITNGNLGVVSSTTITLEMVYNKLVEIEALLANRAGPIGAEENVIIQTDYATVGLYFDGSNYQVI